MSLFEPKQKNCKKIKPQAKHKWWKIGKFEHKHSNLILSIKNAKPKAKFEENGSKEKPKY